SSARSTACFISAAVKPRSVRCPKWSPRRCCQSSTARRSMWCRPAATFSCCRAAATSNALTICTIMVMITGMTMSTITAITTAPAMLEYDFMRNAFAAAGVAAIVSGVVGYFLVLRGQTFAGHALGHIGFAGATGAALIGLAPLWGLLGFTVAAGIGMGLMGERLSGRDVAIGVVLSLALGFGLLFLHYYTAFAAQATALLFGNVLAVDRSMIGTLIVLGAITVLGLAAIMRPLIFATLQPELAEAKGVPLRTVSTAFLVIVALAVSQSAQIVGVLLVFALMVGPPATAQRLATGLWSGMILSAGIALAEAWLGMVVAYHTDWPVSFCIAMLSALGYFLTRGNLVPRREVTP